MKKVLDDTVLQHFRRRPTLRAAQQAFVYYHHYGVEIPAEVVAFIADNFEQRLADTPHEPTDGRKLMSELMIRIANREYGVTKEQQRREISIKPKATIEDVCEQVAAEYGMHDKDNQTAGNRLHNRYKQYIKEAKRRG
mgnify:CR=1 FL=1